MEAINDEKTSDADSDVATIRGRGQIEHVNAHSALLQGPLETGKRHSAGLHEQMEEITPKPLEACSFPPEKMCYGWFKYGPVGIWARDERIDLWGPVIAGLCSFACDGQSRGRLTGAYG